MAEKLSSGGKKRGYVEVGKIAYGVLRNRHRDVLTDSRLVTAHFSAVILGAENLPREKTPSIFVVNHPGIIDTVLTAAHINTAYANVQSDGACEESVLWLVAKNMEHRRRPESKREELRQRLDKSVGDAVLNYVHRSYDLLPVPLNYANPEESREEKTRVLFKARDYLKSPTGSRAVGIFPEGTVEDDSNPFEFLQGVGGLIKMMRGEVYVLPTNSFRGKDKKLHIVFQSPMQFKKSDSREDITQRIQTAIRRDK